MQTKQQLLSQMFEQTAGDVTSSLAQWTGLLTTMGKLYKYPFHEQLMIYAQNPEATACAGFELWNNKMDRYVRRGTKGIALIDPHSDNPQIKYVFDVTDTGGREQSRRPFLWEMQSHYEQPILDMLQNKFKADGKNLYDALDNIAQTLATEYYEVSKQDITNLVEDSFLEELDEDNIRATLINALSVSISYTLMKRCGLDTENHFTHEDFLPIFDFNTTATVSLLGTAVSEQSEQVFREIAKTITKTERSIAHEQLNLQPEGGLPDSQYNTSRATERANRQIRENEENTLNGTSQSTVQPSTTQREVASPPTRNRQDSQQPTRDDNGGIAENKDTSRQDVTADVVGGLHEQSQSTSRGNHIEGTDIQLNPIDVNTIIIGEQMTLFPTEQQQIINIADRQRVKTQSQSAISMPLKEMEKEIQGGTGTQDGKYRVFEMYQKSPSQKDAIDFLKNEYGWYGHSHTFLDGTNGFIDYQPSKGMEIKRYHHDKEDSKTTIKWAEFEKNVRALIVTEHYLTPEEKTDFEEKNIDFSLAETIEKVEAEPILEEAQKVEPTQETVPKPTIETPQKLDPIAETPQKIEKQVEISFSDLLWKKMSHSRLDGWENSTVKQRHIKKAFHDVLQNEAETQRIFELILSNPPKSVTELEDLLNGNVSQVIKDRVNGNEPQEQISMETSSFPYNVGDVVSLENGTKFIIEGISNSEVKLRDPTLHYPIIRAESKENFLYLVDMYSQDLSQEPKPQIEPLKLPPTEPKTQAESKLQAEPKDKGENFHITDMELGKGTKKEKFIHNISAITTLLNLEKENRNATTEEQEILSQYVGWGGLSEAFVKDNSSWHGEYLMLKDLLSEDEYEMARASTLDAYYTSPTIIKSIYDTISKMGFQNGNILEPACGIGNFLGMLPDSMKNSNLYGVELDSITGRIAQKLYPNANIAIKGFEKTDLPDSFFDVVIGNVPFGNNKLNEKRYDNNNFLIHDHFFAKAIDKVRPGGIVAFVTSKGTLDKESPQVRRYLAQRAELLGAVRLPNNAFKANAGTEVTSDIIFLQKRDRPLDVERDWIHLDLDENDISMNSYFVENPEMILGNMEMKSGQFGMESACIPIEGADLANQLKVALTTIIGEITEAELPDMELASDTSILADPSVKNFSYTLVDGEVYYRENSKMVKPELNQTALERVKGLVELRNCTSDLIRYQLDEYSDETIKAEQVKLNQLYDSFTGKYGLINSRGNALAFSADNSYYLLCSLEDVNEDGTLKAKADMFTKRTIKKSVKRTSVDTPSEALAVSIAEKAKIDMGFMCQLSSKEETEIFETLKGVIFLNPMYGYGNHKEEKYLPADEYLSGNVRDKLVSAKKSAKLYPDDYSVNVEALEMAQPKELEASEIRVKLGATWIDKDYIEEFMYETFDTPWQNRGNIEVKFTPYTSEWNISNKNSIRFDNVAAFTTYGSERASAYRILEDTLNLRDVRIYDSITDTDGKEKRVLNKNETDIAQQKQQQIKDAFSDWIFKDPNRRQDLVGLYNEKFNSTRPREYDGKHITFGGMNPEINLREHQINAIARILYGENTMLAHEVGAGKSFEMVAGAMESKRLGLCSKPLFAVPNHLTEQMASEFLRLYPSANILVATKKDFETRNRKKFCARIATGDYDAVIIGHSQFERIPISFERQERLLRDQIKEITDGIEEVKASNGERYTVKQLERTKKGLEQRLEKLKARERKDDVVTFEQLGVDRLYVDEAHSYKNLFLYTKMRNVAGLSTTDAQKSSDMFLKCRYMDEITGGKGIVFATGTPVSNSMTELYTMQRYLQHETLKKVGMLHFDSWASNFGETTTKFELAPEGVGCNGGLLLV